MGFGRSNLGIVILLVASVVLLGVGFHLLTPPFELQFATNAAGRLVQRLENMALLTIVIERAVEVYLGATGKNGPSRHDPTVNADNPPANGPASVAALTLGILLALSGVRVLSVLLEVNEPPPGGVQGWFWNGIDIILSGGMLAGGAFVFHEISEMATGGLANLGSMMSGQTAARQGGKTDEGKDSPSTVNSAATAKARSVIAVCNAIYDQNQYDNAAFAVRAAGGVGVALSGSADDIVSQITGGGGKWVPLNNAADAASKATAGWLVLAGLKGSEYVQPRPYGQVAIVTADIGSQGTFYPYGWWGSSGAQAGKAQPLSMAWGSGDIGSVHYAAYEF